MVEVLFVHGALVRDGDWWWRRVAEQVHERTGVASRAVALPSCGEADIPPGTAGLMEDAASLGRALDAVDDAVVVGHSYGGTVIAEGADHPATRHLLYISSFLPDAGSSQSAVMSAEEDPVMIAPGADGTLGIVGYDADSFGARFWQDVPDEPTRAGAWERVTRQSAAALLTPTSRSAWQRHPSTYLVCAEDRSTSVRLQRFHAARASTAIELPTGHHPFLSRPDLVADALVAVLPRD
jgi:pimeloyl-ACP methyl ester carboxylesterase